MKKSVGGDKQSPVVGRELVDIELEAHALAEAELWGQAARHLTRAARRDPSDVARWKQIITWHQQDGDSAAATEAIELAIRSNWEELTDRINSQGTWTDFDLSHERKLIELMFLQAEMQIEMQQLEACISTCRAILELKPNHHATLEMLATALLHSGDVSEATETIKKLLIISPRDPLHRLKYATLLQLQGESGASLYECERVLAAYPDAPFSKEAREAIEMLDHMQTQQVLLRASEDNDFRLQLQHALDETLQNHGFYLSDNGRETLRLMIGDGRVSLDAPIRIH